MIRFNTLEDKEQIIALFNECFPEDLEFNAWYFSTQFEKGKYLLFETDGKITSMLEMKDQTLALNDKLYTATYIYGACTDRNYRRQHQMAKLLEKSFEIDMEKGKDFSILIPQQKWLFKFYDSFGYEKGFYLEKEHVVGFNENSAYDKPQKAEISEIASLNEIYEKNLSGNFRIARSTDEWKTQFELVNTLGSGVMTLKKDGKIVAYGFIYDSEGMLFGHEIFALNDEYLEEFLQSLCAYYKKPYIKYMKFSENDFNNAFGMVKFLKEPIRDFYGYINLLFN